MKNLIIILIIKVALCCYSFSVYANTEANTTTAQYEKSSVIQLSNDGRYIWAVLSGLNQVVVVSTENQSVVATIDVGKDPRAITLTKDGKTAFVAVSALNGVSRIDVIDDTLDGFYAMVREDIGEDGVIITGAEPRSLVIDSSRGVVYVGNSVQDTLSVISLKKNKVISAVNLRKSVCNIGDRDRHYYPQGMALDTETSFLYVNRFLSFTTENGHQRDDVGKEGIVCAVKVKKRKGQKVRLSPRKAFKMAPSATGVLDKNGEETYAFPNQLYTITLRDGKAYLPNIGASPTGPQDHQTITQSFVNSFEVDGHQYTDRGALNLHLGGVDPMAGSEELYFSNPIDIAFDSTQGAGRAFVISAGSDVLVELDIDESGYLGFTVDDDTTKYIDLNDPDNGHTAGRNAGKNPLGVVYSGLDGYVYTLNNISRNISVVHPDIGVVNVIEVADLPEPGSIEERLLVGEEMFFSSRGYFETGDSTVGSMRNRLSEKGRQNCASCHAGGFTDGVVWQFATGPRKTISVNGTFSHTDPTDQRIINASAIFDEVEDADFNTRLVSSPGWLGNPVECIDQSPYNEVGASAVDPDHGLILGEWNVFDLAACVMNQFERPNADRPQPYVRLPNSYELVKSHDALVDWQKYAIRTPNAPLTRSELKSLNTPNIGGLKDKWVQRGRHIFESDCASCHNGSKWTLSKKDFVSPPAPEEVATESGVDGVNPFQFLHRFLIDIDSYGLGVPNGDNSVPGYRDIGGEEVDGAGRLALGKDYNGDGKGDGYNVYSILGAWSSQPYYHNGACETLECVISDVNHRESGAGVYSDALNRKKNINALTEFLRSIDENSETF
jgi:YVTN family beta-propeller protein